MGLIASWINAPCSYLLNLGGGHKSRPSSHQPLGAVFIVCWRKSGKFKRNIRCMMPYYNLVRGFYLKQTAVNSDTDHCSDPDTGHHSEFRDRAWQWIQWQINSDTDHHIWIQIIPVNSDTDHPSEFTRRSSQWIQRQTMAVNSERDHGSEFR